MSDGQLKKTDKKLKIASDVVWSVAGLVLMNGLLQLFVYPSMRSSLGSDRFGTIQSIFAVVSVMAVTFGSAANYSRMVGRTKKIDCNPDCNIFLSFVSLLCVPVSLVTLIAYKEFSWGGFILLTVLMIFSVLRYYGDVNYRLDLDFKGFFFYYAVISAGYLAGTLLFRYVSSSGPMYLVAIIIGEAACFVFAAFRGFVYKPPYFAKSEHFKENERSMLVLSATNLIGALALNADKIILKMFSGGEAVTIYYLAALLGKVVSLLTTPLNGVLISYLTRYTGKITKKIFGIVALILVAVAVLATFVCYVGSYIFVKWKYPDDFSAAKQYFLIANAGQIIYFLSNTLMVVLLRFADEKYQAYVNIFYACVFAALVIPLTKFFGLTGIAWAIVAVNAIKFIAIIFVGMHRISVNEKTEKTEA